MSGPYGPAPGGAPGGQPGGPGPYPPSAPGGYQPHQPHQPPAYQPPAGQPPHPAPGSPQGGPGAPHQGSVQPGPAQSAPWQGGQQQWAGAAPAAPKNPPDLTKLAPLAIAALGVLNFIWGFLSVESGSGFQGLDYVTAYANVMLLLAGLLALAPMLPKAGSYLFPVAALSVTAALGVIFGFILGEASGVGMVLLLIFSIVQAIAAVGWWLMEAGVVAQPVGGTPPSGPPAQQPAAPGWPGSSAPGGHSHAPYPGPQPGAPSAPPAAGPFPGAGGPPAAGPVGPPSGAQPAGGSGSFGTQPPSGAQPTVGYDQPDSGTAGRGFGPSDGDDNPDETQQLRF